MNNVFNNWKNKYNLAKKYYHYYGNLEIPSRFITKNGYEYDKEGIQLGMWLANQKRNYRLNKLTQEQIRLLEEIEIKWDKNHKWDEMYNYLVEYFNFNGNIDISQRYTEENIDIGRWVSNQKQTYRGQTKGKLTIEQIELLEELNIEWFSKKLDEKLKKETITNENKIRKQREILNRVRSYILKIDSKTPIDKKEINKGFIKELTK